jgi:hypothetical protein
VIDWVRKKGKGELLINSGKMMMRRCIVRESMRTWMKDWEEWGIRNHNSRSTRKETTSRVRNESDLIKC